MEYSSHTLHQLAFAPTISPLMQSGTKPVFLNSPVLSAANEDKAVNELLNQLIYLEKVQASVSVVLIDFIKQLLTPAQQLVKETFLYRQFWLQSTDLACFLIKHSLFHRIP
ncbi:hypothetical protein ES703_115225 [subsurface metagenome]